MVGARFLRETRRLFTRMKGTLRSGMQFAVRVIYSGPVQGVGFRYQTKILSRHYDVQGYVRNQADGTVELRVEGEKLELERFLCSITERMSENIDDAVVQWLDASGDFSAFEIRHR